MGPRQMAKQRLVAAAIITPMGAFLVYAGYRIEQPVMTYTGVSIVVLGLAFAVWGLVSLLRAPAPPRPAAAVADAVPSIADTAPPTSARRAPSLAEAEEAVIDIASRTVGFTDEPTFHFICSGNESLIRAYYGLLRVGSAVYGGSAAILSASNDDIVRRAAEAGAIATAFGGTRCMASAETAVATVADVLADAARVGVERAYVALAIVGPGGLDWMRETYTGVMRDAVSQGILPYPMYVTGDERGAAAVYHAFRLVEGEPMLERTAAAARPRTRAGGGAGRRCASCGRRIHGWGEFVDVARAAGFVVDPLTGDATSSFGVVGDVQRRFDELEETRGYVCRACGKTHCTACLMKTAVNPVTNGPRCPSCGEGPHGKLDP